MHDTPGDSADANLKRWLADCLIDPVDPPTPLPAGSEAALLDLAEAEGVGVLLAYHARRHSLPLSPHSLSRLQQLERSRVASNLSRQQEVESLLADLEVAGVPVLLVKGEALAHRLYPEPHLRARADSDLLFADKAGAECAWRLLQARGYARKPTLQGRFVGFQFPCTREIAPGAHMQFDLHNQSSDYLWFARRLTFVEFMADSEELVLGTRACRGPGPVHALLHACAHRVANRPYGTENRLVWLYDIHLLARELSQSGRWQAFCRAAADKQLARICLEGLSHSGQWFGAEFDLQPLLAASADEERGLSMSSTRRSLFLADLLHNPGTANKLRQLREHLLPAPAYMRARYSLGSSFWLPLYYLLRLLRGLVRPWLG